jgi:hypothetical protein
VSVGDLCRTYDLDAACQVTCPPLFLDNVRFFTDSFLVSIQVGRLLWNVRPPIDADELYAPQSESTK